MWFRADLRTVDNRALHAACAAADRGVIAVFIVASRQWREHDWGDPRIDFVWRSLKSLHVDLVRLNIPLHVLFIDGFDDVPAELCRFAATHECDTLFYNLEYEVNERRRDEAVKAAFARNGRRVRAFHDQTVIPPDVLRTKSDGRFYTVFSPFRRAWTTMLNDDGVPEVLPAPRRMEIAATAIPPFPEDARSPALAVNVPAPILEWWPAGETAANERLQSFVADGLQEYKERRNFPADIGGTSRLSGYLAVGAISARACLHAALERNRQKIDKGNPQIDTWISELVWREFYRHVLVGYPRVCMNGTFRREYRHFPFRDDPESFDAWCAGRTGIPIVDAAMRQLNTVGWMHNRLRMVVAMVLTKNLLIDFRAGERYFMNRLVDGDFAQNNGGWQWSASTGTDAAPYFRIFNPYSQSKRFDPEGAFIQTWVPELEGVEPAALHHPEKFSPELRLRLGYPDPIFDATSTRARAIEVFQAVSATEGSGA